MTTFNKIDGTVLLRKSGVFKPCDVYERKGELFAKYSGGFVRLNEHAQTSIPNLVWEELDIEAPFHAQMARLTLTSPVSHIAAVN